MKLTKRDVDDVYRLDFGPGTAPIILSEEEMDELRAHLQAERDEQLGRWRDPENPNIVVYPRPDDDDEDGRCVSLVDESSGEYWLSWERIAIYDSSARYFAAHPTPKPEPKPWEDAEPVIILHEGADEDEGDVRWVGEVVSCPRQCRRHHKPEPSSSVVFLHEDGVKQTPAERFASWLLERKASRQAAREYEARRCYPSSTRPNY